MFADLRSLGRNSELWRHIFSLFRLNHQIFGRSWGGRFLLLLQYVGGVYPLVSHLDGVIVPARQGRLLLLWSGNCEQFSRQFDNFISLGDGFFVDFHRRMDTLH